MIALPDINLAFFLSRATPLTRWDEKGLLERETAVYRRLGKRLNQVNLVTSGGEEELAYQALLGDIQILYNRWGISANLYTILAPLLHWQPLRQANVYKTNQLDGAWAAVLAAKFHRKPVIVRAGYLWADNFAREYGHNLKARLIRLLERFSLRQATCVVVTTSAMKQTIVDAYRLDTARIHVIPNYIDTEFFRKSEDISTKPTRPFNVGFVGRLNAVKNLPLVIEALAGIADVCLTLIGEGEEKEALLTLAQQYRVNLRLVGKVPNQQLPEWLNQFDLFVLPSQFEGHPKALIEAMACGTAVLGTDVEGIREVIRHGETGWLCPPTVKGLRQAIQTLLADADLRRRLGENGRQFAVEHFSLDQIAQKEFALYRQLLDGRSRSRSHFEL